MPPDADVLVIGAGPSGSLASALLLRRGFSVLTLERSVFPRFSIGESLLPQSMELLEGADLLRPAVEAGFQHKNGAVFTRAGRRTAFDFREKSCPGWGTTFQVPRAAFDLLMAERVRSRGARVLFGQEIVDAQVRVGDVRLAARDLESGGEREYRGGFVLDASGGAKVLARLMGLERPSRLAPRRAAFAHVQDPRPPRDDYDRNKILIAVHPERKAVWSWLIPFSDGRSSVGIVEDGVTGPSDGPGGALEALRSRISEEPEMRRLLQGATWDTPARSLEGYSSEVSALHGPGFALLGNAGEFLDPVFSSGVTLALKSASLAADLLTRERDGTHPDWTADFDRELGRGVDCFRAFVEAWYDGSFQDVLFFEPQEPRIRRQICSILAGYVWDRDNPFAVEPGRLKALAKLCAPA